MPRQQFRKVGSEEKVFKKGLTTKFSCGILNQSSKQTHREIEMKTNVETKIRQVERRTNDSALILAMYLDEAIIMKLSVNDLVKIAQGMRQLEKDCY